MDNLETTKQNSLSTSYLRKSEKAISLSACIEFYFTAKFTVVSNSLSDTSFGSFTYASNG